MTPPSAEVIAKQIRLDYQTTRDAIVDEVNAKIGSVEAQAHASLVVCHEEFMGVTAYVRRGYLAGEIDGEAARLAIEIEREKANAKRAAIIEVRMARLGEIDRWGRLALDSAKEVYRTAIGDPTAA